MQESYVSKFLKLKGVSLNFLKRLIDLKSQLEFPVNYVDFRYNINLGKTINCLDFSFLILFLLDFSIYWNFFGND